MENELKIEEIKKQISEIIDLDMIGEFIKSNEAQFEYEGIKYRVKRPNLIQKQEAYQKKIEKFSKLLDAVDEEGKPTYKLEDDLKKSYLKRGIDIDALSTKFYNLGLKRDDLMIKLGEALKKKSPDEDCKILKTEIENINNEIQTLVIKKTQLLESSIEHQCLIYFYTYLTFLITEKYVQGKDLGEGQKESDPGWIRAWNTWDEFKIISETLLNQASKYTTIIGSYDIE